MGYPLLVAAVVAVHFAFIAFMVFGGFLTWRWPWVIWPHVAAVLWGIVSTALGLDCALTDLERWARPRAGMAQLPSDGFIAHYLTGVLYPASAANVVRVLAIVVVLVAWAGWLRRRRH
ncbi:hypothetical protein BOO86_12935 [Mycobacterium sp. CBMA 234]|uniref:DUF2784 domain-containing protein n=1 Tax=Mycolicibacterium sp. CBMA 234 TaxID=1918495 RepID=UPI0012DDA534|nr:DUF2784 domain-containing protein [Mycolicibacterium sp. CBMA 234]MUL65376.1 hypothetical protein [Mycolicibacterium sp. CBMA 234]